MQHVLLVANRLCRSDKGQDLVEYGLLAMLIAVAAVVAVTTVGTTILTVFWNTIGLVPF
jgi:Flp pilus assembly pilin Flp